MKREAPLLLDPATNPVTLPVLVQIATRIEREAVQRYAFLASTMERRGEVATAAALRVMLDEERKHVDAVDHWAAGLGAPLDDAAAYEWHLPDDLSTSWDEVAGSARLTPYRAFAIAVDNEQRAFTMYSYLAASATEPRVAAEAERLALEELRHAALMRRWRRQAYHRERRAEAESAPPEEPLAIASIAELQALLAQREAVIAAHCRALAARLRTLGDDESARLLESLVQPAVAAAPTADATVPVHAGAAPASDDPVHLLVAAQAPLEALSETLDRLLPAMEGELFAQAAEALGNVVSRLSRLALHTERRLRAG